jgi:DedD protein
MEKKKLLLVAVSVGVFLAIAICISIVILPTKVTGSQSVATGISSSSSRPITPGAGLPAEAPSQPITIDPITLLENPGGTGGLQPHPAAGTIQEDPFPGSNGDNSGATIISIPRPTTAAVPDTTADAGSRSTTAPSSAPPVTNRPAAPSPATPAPAAVKPAARAVSAAPPVKSAAAESRPAASAARKAQNDYWIQTGSFKNKTGAEKVRETLAQKGITSIIQTIEKDGTRYRVRVGPYTSETEANYWLALVKSIEGFDKSLVMSQSRSPL